MIQDIFSRGAQLMLMMGMMKWVQNIIQYSNIKFPGRIAQASRFG